MYSSLNVKIFPILYSCIELISDLKSLFYNYIIFTKIHF